MSRASPTARRRRYRLAAVLLPLALLGVAEIALRVAGFENDASPPAYLFLNPEAGYASSGSGAMVPDDVLFWRLRPGFSGADGTEYIARTGYRSDFGPTPPDGTRRIACLGDSSTFGLQVPASATWSAIAEGFLRAERENVEVLNLGVPGYTSHQGLVLLRTEVLALDPDVVVCAFGTFNDWVPARGRTDAEQQGGQPGESLRVVQAVAWLLGRTAFDDPSRLVGPGDRLDDIDTSAWDEPRRVGPDAFEENLGELVETARDAGVRPVLLASPLPAETLARNPIAAEYAEITRRVADEAAVPLVDGWELFAASHLGESDLFADFCHPSAAGHAILGTALAELLRTGEE